MPGSILRRPGPATRAPDRDTSRPVPLTNSNPSEHSHNPTANVTISRTGGPELPVTRRKISGPASPFKHGGKPYRYRALSCFATGYVFPIPNALVLGPPRLLFLIVVQTPQRCQNARRTCSHRQKIDVFHTFFVMLELLLESFGVGLFEDIDKFVKVAGLF